MLGPISDALAGPASLRSIEIIPGDGSDTRASLPPEALVHSPCILIEGNLGVPQKPLYKAYIASSRMFTLARQAARSTEIIMSSSVILLTNPAHNTALNARKRLVASGGLDPQVELHFIGLIISGVKDASKQGILWHHRRWLLNRLYPPSSSDAAEQQVFAEIPTHVLAHEINLVERATEVYPRNYYARAHRGLCVRSAALGSDLSISVPIVDAEITTVQKWLELHVSDGTAAHHLWFCASLLPASGLSGSSEQRPDPGQIAHRIQSLHSHAQDLVMRYPEHEALWIYLRASISLLTQLEPIDASRVREAGLQQVNETASTIGDPATAAMMLWNLERFRNWYQRLDTPT